MAVKPTGSRSLLVSAVFLFAVFRLASAQTAQRTCSNGATIGLEIGYESSATDLSYELSDPALFSAVWFEVWDGPHRLGRKQMTVAKKGTIAWAPHEDPPETPSDLSISVYDPELKGRSVSDVLVGGVESGATFPRFRKQSFVLEEGASWSKITLEGELLGPVAHFALLEQETSGTWIVRQDLVGIMLDLRHTTVEIPSGYLARPTVLEVESVPPGLYILGEEKTPSFEPITIRVMSRDRPILSEISPKEISADDLTNNTVIQLLGSGFTTDSQVVTLFGGAELATKTQFISTSVFQVRIDPEDLNLYWRSTHARSIQFSVRNGDDLHVSDVLELEILPTPSHPLSEPLIPVITSAAPYPVPLMDYHSPDFSELKIYGNNFRQGQRVRANNGDVSKELKTEYVSPQELDAQLPRELWQEHRLSAKLVTRTKSGFCSVEVREDE